MSKKSPTLNKDTKVIHTNKYSVPIKNANGKIIALKNYNGFDDCLKLGERVVLYSRYTARHLLTSAARDKVRKMLAWDIHADIKGIPDARSGEYKTFGDLGEHDQIHVFAHGIWEVDEFYKKKDGKYSIRLRFLGKTA